MHKRVQVADASALDVFSQFGVDTGPVPPQGPWRAWAGLLAAAGLVMLAVLVVLALVLIRNFGDRGLAQSEEAYQVGVQDLRDAAAELKVAVGSGQSVLDGSAGQVSDDAVRAALATELDAARELLTQAEAVDPTSGFTTASNVDKVAAEVRDLTTTVGTRTDSLTAASDAAAANQASFQLVQATVARDAALSALGTSIQSGEEVYRSSAGMVADDAVRQSLRTTLDSATAVHSAVSVEANLATVQSETQSLGEAKSTLDAATQAVTDSQWSWQAEQDRVAQDAQRQAEEAQRQAEDAQRQAQEAELQRQFAWLRQQPPTGVNPDGSAAWWRFQDPQGNLFCLYANGSVTAC